MKIVIRSLILAAVVLSGFASSAHATSFSNAPQPMPPGVKG